jgi:hypothetical protein
MLKSGATAVDGAQNPAVDGFVQAHPAVFVLDTQNHTHNLGAVEHGYQLGSA